MVSESWVLMLFQMKHLINVDLLTRSACVLLPKAYFRKDALLPLFTAR